MQKSVHIFMSKRTDRRINQPRKTWPTWQR